MYKTIWNFSLLGGEVIDKMSFTSNVSPVRRFSPVEFQPPKCGKRSFTRCNGHWICHKDLEKPILCMGI